MRWFTLFVTLLLLAVASGRAEESTATVETLVETLLGDDPEIAARAAYALGGLGEKGASGVDALVEALSDKRPSEKRGIAVAPVGPPPVAEVAGYALAAIGKPAVPALVSELDRADDEIRRRVVRILGQIGPAAKPALPRLREIATGGDNPRTRYGALDSLAAIGLNEEAHVDLFRSQLKDQDREVRGLAIQTLGRMGDLARPAVADLIALLDDQGVRTEAFAPDFYGERPLRRDAAEALGRLGADDAIPVLERVMREDSNSSVAAEAAVALIRIRSGHKAARTALVNSIHGVPGAIAEPETAINAIATLGKRGVWAIEMINSHRAARSGSIRQAVMAANGDIGGPTAPAILVAGLSDPDWGVRFKAAGAFRELGADGAPAVPAMIALLRAEIDEDPADVVDQDKVVEALGWVGKAAHPAIPDIEEWGNRQTIEVWRETAREAIKRIRADAPP